MVTASAVPRTTLNRRTPLIVGAVIAAAVGLCVFGGGKRIIKITEKIVPVMGILYVLAALIVIAFHVTNIPAMFGEIFKDAFNFRFSAE